MITLLVQLETNLIYLCTDKNCFGKVWKAYGFIKNEPLIKFEDFLKEPNEVVGSLQNWYHEKFRFGMKATLPMPHQIEMDYTKKFANYDEIQGWFNE